MSTDGNRALILHLANGGEPLVFALSDKSAKSLQSRLHVLMSSGGVDSPELADGTTASVNFNLVATAHIDAIPATAHVYGNPKRSGHGFRA